MSVTFKIPGITKPVHLNTPVHRTRAPNFTWGEATHGGRRIPRSTKEVSNIVEVAEMLQKVRDITGKPLTVTSWYRDAATNAAVGGATKSYHLTGGAADFKIEGYTGKQLYDLCNGLFPENGGVGYYGASRKNICHLDNRKGRGRWYHS